MHINVPVHDIAKFNPPTSLEQAFALIQERRPAVEALARRAFAQRDPEAWYEAQSMLYHWNLQELERTVSVTDLSRLVTQVLRNTILEVQYDSSVTGTPTLACWDRFDSETALVELREAAMAHRINSHPLLDHIEREGLTPDEMRIFLANYYINNRVFHLHVAAQSLSAPLEMRVDMYQNLYDELGRGSYEGAHPVLFLRNFQSIGKPEQVDSPLGGALNLLNTKIYLTFLSGDFRKGVGGLGFLELLMPNQMRKIYHGLLKSGLSEEETLFWKLHIEIDAQHGESWVSSMTPHVQTREHALSMLQGGLAMAEARASFYDSVWEAISLSRREQERKAA
jgi:pyrroloquinoline quinone (PQQ) biosynthesis protein C